MTQSIRCKIVKLILSDDSTSRINSDYIEALRYAYNELTADSNTNSFQREMVSACNEKFIVNVKDEIIGLQVNELNFFVNFNYFFFKKDLLFLDNLNILQNKTENANVLLKELFWNIDFETVLQSYHPVSCEAFIKEYNNCIKFIFFFF